MALLCCVLAACGSRPVGPLHGMQLAPSQPAAGFTLTDQEAKLFRFDSTRGQAVALYFGFTHCKDVCPQTLALLAKARSRARLSPQQVRIVMVTVDPAHDTPAALRAFFKKLRVNATGLTGKPAALRAVYKAYGIAVEPRRRDILHTDTIFLIGPRGRIIETLVPQSSLEDIAADLRRVVE
ncbi:MAG TPA: SCO family protein [Candidatus Baltobacteraceae bacterium]